MHASWILSWARLQLTNLCLLLGWVCFFDWRWGDYFISSNNARTTWLAFAAMLARWLTYFLKRTIQIATSLQIRLSKYQIVICGFNACLSVLILTSRTLLLGHQLARVLVWEFIVIFAVFLRCSNRIVMPRHVTGLLPISLKDRSGDLARGVWHMFNDLRTWILNLRLWILLMRIAARCLYINYLGVNILCLYLIVFASCGAVFLLNLQRSILLLLLHPLNGSYQLLVVNFLHRAIRYCGNTILVYWLFNPYHRRFGNFCWCSSLAICLCTWLGGWVTRITACRSLIYRSLVQEGVVDVWIDFAVDVNDFKTLLDLDAPDDVAVFAACGAWA